MWVLIKAPKHHHVTWLNLKDLKSLSYVFPRLSFWLVQNIRTSRTRCLPICSDLLGRQHGLSTEPVPVYAYVGSSKKLKDLKDV